MPHFLTSITSLELPSDDNDESIHSNKDSLFLWLLAQYDNLLTVDDPDATFLQRGFSVIGRKIARFFGTDHLGTLWNDVASLAGGKHAIISVLEYETQSVSSGMRYVSLSEGEASFIKLLSPAREPGMLQAIVDYSRHFQEAKRNIILSSSLSADTTTPPVVHLGFFYLMSSPSGFHLLTPVSTPWMIPTVPVALPPSYCMTLADWRWVQEQRGRKDAPPSLIEAMGDATNPENHTANEKTTGGYLPSSASAEFQQAYQAALTLLSQSVGDSARFSWALTFDRDIIPLDATEKNLLIVQVLLSDDMELEPPAEWQGRFAWQPLSLFEPLHYAVYLPTLFRAFTSQASRQDGPSSNAIWNRMRWPMRVIAYISAGMPALVDDVPLEEKTGSVPSPPHALRMQHASHTAAERSILAERRLLIQRVLESKEGWPSPKVFATWMGASGSASGRCPSVVGTLSEWEEEEQAWSAMQLQLQLQLQAAEAEEKQAQAQAQAQVQAEKEREREGERIAAEVRDREQALARDVAKANAQERERETKRIAAAAESRAQAELERKAAAAAAAQEEEVSRIGVFYASPSGKSEASDESASNFDFQLDSATRDSPSSKPDPAALRAEIREELSRQLGRLGFYHRETAMPGSPSGWQRSKPSMMDRESRESPLHTPQYRQTPSGRRILASSGPSKGKSSHLSRSSTTPRVVVEEEKPDHSSPSHPPSSSSPSATLPRTGPTVVPVRGTKSTALRLKYVHEVVKGLSALGDWQRNMAMSFANYQDLGQGQFRPRILRVEKGKEKNDRNDRNERNDRNDQNDRNEREKHTPLRATTADISVPIAAEELSHALVTTPPSVGAKSSPHPRTPVTPPLVKTTRATVYRQAVSKLKLCDLDRQKKERDRVQPTARPLGSSPRLSPPSGGKPKRQTALPYSQAVTRGSPAAGEIGTSPPHSLHRRARYTDSRRNHGFRDFELASGRILSVEKHGQRGREESVGWESHLREESTGNPKKGTHHSAWEEGAELYIAHEQPEDHSLFIIL